MPMQIVPWLFNCAHFAVMLVAWGVLYRRREVKTVPLIGGVALGLATANALFGAATFTYYELQPHVFRAPWQDPEILNLGLLFFLAPAAMVLGVVAAVRGAPKWLMGLVELASVPLLLVGISAVVAV
jgi:hypothetical protein